MSNYIYIAMSIDGFIAEKDGGLEWLSEFPNPDGSDLGFAHFMDGIDVIVMGRNTFEKVLSFGEWPYNKPVWVMSRTQTAVPTHLAEKVEMVTGEPDSVLEKAGDMGFQNLYVDGGALIRSFLENDLIDEMIITIVPIILGDGIPLFTRLSTRLRFALQESETRIGEFVKNHYRRMR